MNYYQKLLDFLTTLLQDHIGGLHAFHQDHWVDVPPIPGAFVVIIGDLPQIRTIRWHYFTNPRTFYDLELDLFALTSYVIETASSRFLKTGCWLITSVQEHQFRASSQSMSGFVPR